MISKVKCVVSPWVEKTTKQLLHTYKISKIKFLEKIESSKAVFCGNIISLYDVHLILYDYYFILYVYLFSCPSEALFQFYIDKVLNATVLDYKAKNVVGTGQLHGQLSHSPCHGG